MRIWPLRCFSHGPVGRIMKFGSRPFRVCLSVVRPTSPITALTGSVPALMQGLADGCWALQHHHRLPGGSPPKFGMVDEKHPAAVEARLSTYQQAANDYRNPYRRLDPQGTWPHHGSIGMEFQRSIMGHLVSSAICATSSGPTLRSPASTRPIRPPRALAGLADS